jgi:hypothetical protein
MLVKLALAAALAAAPQPLAVPTRADLEALLQPAWRALPTAKDGPFWSLRTTPALPDAWPAPRGLVVFAFAGGMQPGLMDGEHTARPWASVAVAPTLGVERLRPSLEDAGVQGVRPIGGKEVEIYRTEAAAQAELLAHPAAPGPVAKAYYCLWAGYNGVIVAALPAPQRAFLAALCPSK